VLGAVLGAGVASLALMWHGRRAVLRARAAERRARAAERMADLGAMTGGLAHEIKNPLSTIGLNAQLLAEAIEELPTDEETRGRLTRRVGVLRREADRLKGILTDFLEYAGALRLDRRRISVNRLVDELADFFMPQAEQQGARLRVDLGPGSLEAHADEHALKQALLNLMLNAVQAMSGGGERSARDLFVRTRSTRDADGRATVSISVIDTGPGMTEEVRSRIFEPYFTTKAGGSGLGLPTTRRLIEAHGGRLEVFTEPGKGTAFVVVLPVDADASSAQAAQANETPVDRQA